MADDGAERIEVAARSVAVHPAKRWGALIRLALTCNDDLATVGAWAREAGMCETQLRMRCRLAGMTAKVSLDFVRVLRAAVWKDARGGALEDYLDVGDDRTMKRLFARVGLNPGEQPTPLEYVSKQHVIRHLVLIREVAKILADSDLG